MGTTPPITEKTTKIAQAVDALENDLVAFIRELVRVPSLPGEEGAVGGILAGKLASLGMQVAQLPISPKTLKDHPAFCDDGFPYENRSNVIGILYDQVIIPDIF